MIKATNFAIATVIATTAIGGGAFSLFSNDNNQTVVAENILNKPIEFNEIEETLFVKEEIEKASLDLYSLKRKNPIAIDFINGKTGVPTQEELNELSRIYQLPENMLYSLMIKESRGNINAASHKGAKGLFQFLSQTAREYGLVVNKDIDERNSPWLSADASARYLSWLFTYLHSEKNRSDIENYDYVLASYNAGLSNVKRNGKLVIPPFEETVNYVEIIKEHAKGNLYIVQKGDLLRNIIKEHDLSRAEISRMNYGIKQTNLIAGGYLYINPAEFDDLEHIAISGDSLYRISQKYGVNINEIKIANNLSNDIIGIGQRLRIPF